MDTTPTQRETQTITTPSGATVEYFSYLTGKEARSINKIFGKQITIEAGADQDVAKQGAAFRMTADAIVEIQEAALKVLIVSVNGNKEGAVDAVDNFKVEDYNAVVKALNPIVEPLYTKTDFLGGSSTK